MSQYKIVSWKRQKQISLGMLLAAILLALAISTALGGTGGYELSQGEITSGGGEISGGSYLVAYSIAGLNSTTSSGGEYTLIGGVTPIKYNWEQYLPFVSR